jgi:hypothetical protein
MSGSKANVRVRGAVEVMIRIAGPGLDLMLAVGDRCSRVLDRGDRGYSMVRLQHDGESAPRGLDARALAALRSREPS